MGPKCSNSKLKTPENLHFKPGSIVEISSDDDGFLGSWYVGTVIRRASRAITEEREDGKFAVFFRGTREQIVFGEEDLRLHWEWNSGEWQPPLEGVQEQKEEEEVAEGKRRKMRRRKS
ncbi:hypothetical protein GH714_006318 [Hevea brasiliensis]|uniref:Agenet domain-containing protein n=1 Tax=Hevea brasiliensis TaxID=3981 RepID=A0A6A6NFW8_HEVBR|nr:hypothetical protein GH714_006318 [Hevea brasiliensis]